MPESSTFDLSLFRGSLRLGSIVALTDSSQAVVQRYTYDTFGMVTASSPEFENAYAYTGREWDKETGLCYYRARYYDPMEGRFISKDPIGFAGGDVNVYSYVQNQPINKRDPSGLFGEGGMPYIPVLDPNKYWLYFVEKLKKGLVYYGFIVGGPAVVAVAPEVVPVMACHAVRSYCYVMVAAGTPKGKKY